jgi:hypothetical protein
MPHRLLPLALALCGAACSSRAPAPADVPEGGTDAADDGADSAGDATTTVCSPSFTLVNIELRCTVSTTVATGLCVTDVPDPGPATQTVCLFSPVDTWFVAAVDKTASLTGAGWEVGPTSFATAQGLTPLSKIDESACEALLASIGTGEAMPELCTKLDAAVPD